MPNQQGFSSSQLAGLNTQALDTTGANYSNAARALQGQLAGRGGNSGLVGGPQQQVSSVLASQAQGQLSNEENQINEATWAQGEANYNTAIASLSGVTGLESPLGYASAGNNANQLAYSEAQVNQQESQQGLGSMIGAIGGLVGIGADVASGGITGSLSGALSGLGGSVPGF